MIMVRGDGSEPRLFDLEEGTPLGIFEGEFSEEKIDFEKGDIFILYTDGVTEAMNTRGEMFGRERLVKLVKNNANLKPEALAGLIQNRVKAFESKKRQHDDITVIVIRTA